MNVPDTYFFFSSSASICACSWSSGFDDANMLLASCEVELELVETIEGANRKLLGGEDMTGAFINMCCSASCGTA